MARRGVSELHRHGGEDVGLPWLVVDAASRPDALDAARAAIAAMLESIRTAFDVELD